VRPGRDDGVSPAAGALRPGALPDPLAQAVADARVWAAGRYPYIAAAVFSLQPVAARGLAKISVDERWRLFLDPAIAEDWTRAQLGGALIHQIHHLLRDHIERAVRDQNAEVRRLWQFAADAEINDDLINERVPLPHGAITPTGLGLPEGRLAEEYVARLRHEPSDPTVLFEDIFCSTCAPDGTPDIDVVDLPPGLTSGEIKALRRQIAKQVDEEIGEVPASLRRWAGQEVGGRINWRRELARHLRAAATETRGPADYTYRRPSRRAAAAPDVILPGMRQPRLVLAIVVDTSGSIPSAALADALGEIQVVVGWATTHASSVWVVTCDVEVGEVRRVRSEQDVAAVSLIGGGGTDLRVGIARAIRLRPEPDAVIVLTDGLTPWPARRPRPRLIVGLLGARTSVGLPAWATALPIGQSDL
jgi:predicted metal-dependent peptidase